MRSAMAGTGVGLLAVANHVIPTLPEPIVDPTYVIAGGVAVAFAAAWFRDRMYAGRAHLMLIGLLVAFLPGVQAADSPYATVKLPLMLLGAAGAFFAVQLLRTQTARVAFLVTLAVAGATIAVLLTVVGSTGAASYRATLFDLSPISVGYMCAVAALLALVAAVDARALHHKLLLYAVAAACAFQSATTGSRGPLLAAVMAAAAVYLLSPGRGRLRGSLAIAVFVVGGYQLLRSSTSEVAGRLLLTEDSLRTELWQYCIEAIRAHPWGTGWGDMLERVPVPRSFLLAAGYRQHPHNVVLEAAVEGGWIALVALCAVLVAVLRQFRRASIDTTGRAMFGVAAFALVNALVSSDLAGTRLLWVMIGAGAALMLPSQRLRADDLAAEQRAPGLSRLLSPSGSRLDRAQPTSLAADRQSPDVFAGSRQTGDGEQIRRATSR